MSISGVVPSSPSELARVEDRVSFVYLEHAVIARDANALTATGEDGVFHLPSAGLLVLMLGPGTNVTHQAMMVLADSGAAIVWVGEQGVRYYAGGRPLARSTRLLTQQARIVSNNRSRMAVARRMYEMRFPGEDISSLSMQQLRGREGARVRAIYRECSNTTGVKWQRRDYDTEEFESSDEINQALSAANACLYGVVHAAVVALGCAAGLGVVHTGHDRSFVYDIADLYKANTSIPIAFKSVAALQASTDEGEVTDTGFSDRNLSTTVRRNMRNRFKEINLIEQIVRDVKDLLDDEHLKAADKTRIQQKNMSLDDAEPGENRLWDVSGTVPGGSNYSELGYE